MNPSYSWLLCVQRHILLPLLALLSSVGTSTAAGADAGGYHPSRIKLDIPRIEQDNPRSYQQIVHNKTFWIFPPVTQATVETSQFLQYLRIAAHEAVLDVGTGSGVLAVFAADRARRVVALDIDPLAVENARYNVVQHKLVDRIEVRQSDLFSGVGENEKFDVILFNVGDPGLNNADTFWALHERFLSLALAHLNPNGRIYSHTGYINLIGRMDQLVERYGLKIIEMHMWTASLGSRQPILLVLTPRAPDEKKLAPPTR